MNAWASRRSSTEHWVKFNFQVKFNPLARIKTIPESRKHVKTAVFKHQIIRQPIQYMRQQLLNK